MKLVPLLAILTALALPASATVTWFAPSATYNSNATWPAGGTYGNNFGVAFKTGPSGSYSMDWATIGLSSSSTSGGSASFTISLRNVTNDTAYSAVAGTTDHATDVVNFALPDTTATAFFLNLTEADLPNISSYAMAADTAYALIIYNPSRTIGMTRTTGYAQNTTNTYYTVGSGFSALNTFRNNTPNYTNSPNSYPSLSISFGANAVPEPTSMFLAMFAGGMMLIRRKR